ncbi:hypothetical protein KR018_010156 [Drosophila ironensis]|nr:hypothetical protein KR018_010156 [Drosophila ironensis]
MDMRIKREPKQEPVPQLNDNDDTPLRAGAGSGAESRPESPDAEYLQPMDNPSIAGWESDPESEGSRSSMEEVKPEMKPEMKPEPETQFLDEMLEDNFDNVGNLDGLPSQYSSKDELNEMDLDGPSTSRQARLGDETENLVATKQEILKQLEMFSDEDEPKDCPRSKSKSKKSKKHRSEKKSESAAKESTQRSPHDKHRSSHDKHRSSHDRHRSRHDSHKESKRAKIEQPDREDLDGIPVRSDERQLRVVLPSELLPAPPAECPPSVPPPPPPSQHLSQQDKRNLGIERAETVLQLYDMQTAEAQEEVTEVLMVDTVAQMPVSETYQSQNSFENPSPICNNYNVEYEFNSPPGTYINLEKWGLVTVPEATRELLRILGINLQRLQEIQDTTTVSSHILKLIQERLDQGLSPAEEECNSATLFKNAATQTTREPERPDPGARCAFWQAPNFSAIGMTQAQANVLFALEELQQTLPSASWAEALFMALKPALQMQRQFLERGNR